MARLGVDGYHAFVFFQIVGQIGNVQTVAAGRQIRQLARLKKLYGPRQVAQDEG